MRHIVFQSSVSGATPTIDRLLFLNRASPLGDDPNLIVHDLKESGAVRHSNTPVRCEVGHERPLARER